MQLLCVDLWRGKRRFGKFSKDGNIAQEKILPQESGNLITAEDKTTESQCLKVALNNGSTESQCLKVALNNGSTECQC